MKITFECKDVLYKMLCEIDEYVRKSPEWNYRPITCLDDVINLILDHGGRCFYFENPEYQAYDARLHGAEVLRDEDGTITGFYFPEKPNEE